MSQCQPVDLSVGNEFYRSVMLLLMYNCCYYCCSLDILLLHFAFEAAIAALQVILPVRDKSYTNYECCYEFMFILAINVTDDVNAGLQHAIVLSCNIRNKVINYNSEYKNSQLQYCIKRCI